VLAGLIVSALMLFCVIALAFTARVDRLSAGVPEAVEASDPETAVSGIRGDLPELP
jgi:hypothetical protein